MEFRPARATDADTLTRLMHASIDAHAPTAYGEEERAEWKARVDPDRLRQWIEDPAEQFVVALEEGVTIGFGSRNGTTIRLLYLAPGAAGKGRGKAIMAVLEEAARREGHSELVLDASKNAVPFYTRLGYGPASVVGCGGDHLLCTRMGKSLT